MQKTSIHATRCGRLNWHSIASMSGLNPDSATNSSFLLMCTWEPTVMGHALDSRYPHGTTTRSCNSCGHLGSGVVGGSSVGADPLQSSLHLDPCQPSWRSREGWESQTDCTEKEIHPPAPKPCCFPVWAGLLCAVTCRACAISLFVTTEVIPGHREAGDKTPIQWHFQYVKPTRANGVEIMSQWMLIVHPIICWQKMPVQLPQIPGNTNLMPEPANQLGITF